MPPDAQQFYLQLFQQGSVDKIDDVDGFESSDEKEDEEIVEAPKKRGRGRPRKNDVLEKVVSKKRRIAPANVPKVPKTVTKKK